jgi:hypothetical protein
MERQSGATRLNTHIMTADPILAAALLANFRTIRFPSSENRSTQSTGHSDWWATAKARRADRLAIDAYRHQLRRQLAQSGHHRFLDHLEPDPAEGGWRLHVFVADDHALSILADINACGVGDPVDFDPEEFVAQRLSGWDSHTE